MAWIPFAQLKRLEIWTFWDSSILFGAYSAICIFSQIPALRVECQSWWQYIKSDGLGISTCTDLQTSHFRLPYSQPVPLVKVIFDFKFLLYLVERRINNKKGKKENILSLWIINWKNKKKKKEKASHSSGFRVFFRLHSPNWSVGRKRQERIIICYFWFWNKSYVSELWRMSLPEVTFTSEHCFIRLQKCS